MVVSDINDNTPEFEEVSYFANVMETHYTHKQTGNDALFLSIGHISATDADEGRNAMINYMIISGNSGKYTVVTD